MNPSSILDSRTQGGIERLCIFGTGGSARETAWIARRMWGDSVKLIFCVSERRFASDPVNGIDVVAIPDLQGVEDTHFIAAVGDIRLRRKAVSLCTNAGLMPVSVIHPSAVLADKIEVGEGSLVYPGVFVSTNVTIGRHVQLNAGCTVSHDVEIGHYCTLSPGCHIAGHVQLGADVFIGTGASIINGAPRSPLVIGDGAVIAAGACVTKSVAPGALMAGVPASRKR